MAKRTPDYVWEAARVIWESTPDISYDELIETLKSIHGDEAPTSASSIGRRIKKYCWLKKSIVPPDNAITTQNGRKTGEVTQKKNAKRKKNAKERNNEESSTELTQYAIIESKIDAVGDSLVQTQEQKKNIILKHRRRLMQAGDLQDRVLINQLDLLDAIDDPNADPETIQKKMVITEMAQRTMNAVSASQKQIAEQEFIICGITIDDFKQSEQDRRLGALEAMDGIADEEARQREKLALELQERMSWLAEVEKNPDDAEAIIARHEGASDDISEAEIIEGEVSDVE